MRATLRSMTAIIAICGSAFAAQTAMAGCGVEGPDAAGMKPMLYRNENAGQFVRTGFDPFHDFGPFNSAGITGMWKFVFTAAGNTGPHAPPDGAVIDAGYATWHDDGTEIMNSGRAPASGSFCMGVWKQTGLQTYRLNHWALSWIPSYVPGQTQSWGQTTGVDEAFKAFGPTNIQETVSLINHGNTYIGMFRLTQYVNDGSSKPITDTAGAPVAFVIVGNISATRIVP